MSYFVVSARGGGLNLQTGFNGLGWRTEALWLPGEPKSRTGLGPVIYSGLFLFLFIANYNHQS